MKREELEQQFANLDLDGSGAISVDELLANMPSGSMEQAQKVLAMLDENQDGKVSLEEFLAAYGEH